MQCQILFSGKNKKNINFSSAKNTQKVVKVIHIICTHILTENYRVYTDLKLTVLVRFLSLISATSFSNFVSAWGAKWDEYGKL